MESEQEPNRYAWISTDSGSGGSAPDEVEVYLDLERAKQLIIENMQREDPPGTYELRWVEESEDALRLEYRSADDTPVSTTVWDPPREGWQDAFLRLTRRPVRT